MLDSTVWCLRQCRPLAQLLVLLLVLDPWHSKPCGSHPAVGVDRSNAGGDRAFSSRGLKEQRSIYSNASQDDPLQRAALMALYTATGGPSWRVSGGSTNSGATYTAWGTEGVSYCRWYGVTCCATSPLTLVDCDGDHSVAVLLLDSFGLVGNLPPELGSLQQLTALAVGNNPGLIGGLPASLASLPHFLWLSVQDTGLVACTDAAAGGDSGGSNSGSSGNSSCTLDSSILYYSDAPLQPYGVDSYACPAAMLQSFQAYAADLPPSMLDLLTLPLAPPPAPGAVISNGAFTRYMNCSCTVPDEVFQLNYTGSASCVDGGSGDSGGGDNGRRGLIVAICVVAIVPQVLFALAIYVCVVHKSTLHRLVRRKEAEMARKRARIPGTPGVALLNGRGMLSLSDVMVTWVFTDVANSTLLWEWNPEIMDRAIEQHNVAMRKLVDEMGGHEIRNEGDSFTLAFHDAVDAVTFCVKAQEQLMAVDWPQELAQHPTTTVVTVGDVTGNPGARGQGGKIMAGLRVRMGINTGVPDDIFLHDLTDHVDYRGPEYDLAGEICDMATGGQILMGPRTLQRWNKVNYSPLLADPLALDGLRDVGQNSFNQGNMMAGASASVRRSSVTGHLSYVPPTLGRDSFVVPNSGPLITAASLRRNSLSHALGGGPPLARLSHTSDDGSRPSGGTVPPTSNRGRLAPVRALQARTEGLSSGDEAVQATSPQARSALRSRLRSKLASPRAGIQHSSASYNEHAAANPFAVSDPRVSRLQGQQLPVIRRASSMEGIQRMHPANRRGVAVEGEGGEGSGSGPTPMTGKFRRKSMTMAATIRYDSSHDGGPASPMDGPLPPRSSVTSKQDSLPYPAPSSSNAGGGRASFGDGAAPPGPPSTGMGVIGSAGSVGGGAGASGSGGGGLYRWLSAGKKSGTHLRNIAKSVVAGTRPSQDGLAQAVGSAPAAATGPSMAHTNSAPNGVVAAAAAAIGTSGAASTGGSSSTMPGGSSALPSPVGLAARDALLASVGGTVARAGSLNRWAVLGALRQQAARREQGLRDGSFGDTPGSREGSSTRPRPQFSRTSDNSRESAATESGTPTPGRGAAQDAAAAAAFAPRTSGPGLNVSLSGTPVQPLAVEGGPPGGHHSVQLPRRGTNNGIGPPRMSLTSDASSLHPLLLPPMNVVGPSGASVVGRTMALRHPQQLRPLGASPLGTEPFGAKEPASRDKSADGGAQVERSETTATLLSPLPSRINRTWTHVPTLRQLFQADGQLEYGPPNPASAQSTFEARTALQQPLGGNAGQPLLLPHVHRTSQNGMPAPGEPGGNGQQGGPGAGDGGTSGSQVPAVVAGPLGMLQEAWASLVRLVRGMLQYCLSCVRLITSSDDPAIEDAWAANPSLSPGTATGHIRSLKSEARSAPETSKGILIDMGYYEHRPPTDGANMQPPQQGVSIHLMQIVPTSVAPRVLLFPWPLELPTNWDKISPGFFDAPGSTRLIFPGMRDLIELPGGLALPGTGGTDSAPGGGGPGLRPMVTVAFSSIEGFKDMAAFSYEAAREALQLHNAAVRETLSCCSGYECKEFNGSFMVAFAEACSAVEWALTLQMVLVCMAWPGALAMCEPASEVLDTDGETVLFRGPRCRVGIYTGLIDRVTPHPKTGRADYFGQPVNRAARLMTAGHGGQVLMERGLLEDVVSEWRRRYEMRRLNTIQSGDEPMSVGTADDDGGLGGTGGAAAGLAALTQMRTARSFLGSMSAAGTRPMRPPSMAGTIPGPPSTPPRITSDPSIPPPPPQPGLIVVTPASPSPLRSPRALPVDIHAGMAPLPTANMSFTGPQQPAPSGPSQRALPAVTITIPPSPRQPQVQAANSASSSAHGGVLPPPVLLSHSPRGIITVRSPDGAHAHSPRPSPLARFSTQEGIGTFSNPWGHGHHPPAAGQHAGAGTGTGGGGSTPASSRGPGTSGGAASALAHALHGLERLLLPQRSTASEHGLVQRSARSELHLTELTSRRHRRGGGGDAHHPHHPMRVLHHRHRGNTTGGATGHVSSSLGSPRAAGSVHSAGPYPLSPRDVLLALSPRDGGAGAGALHSPRDHNLLRRLRHTSMASAGSNSSMGDVLSGNQFELQLASWDPQSRGSITSPREAPPTRRRQRRASVGSLLESLRRGASSSVAGSVTSTAAAAAAAGGSATTRGSPTPGSPAHPTGLGSLAAGPSRLGGNATHSAASRPMPSPPPSEVLNAAAAAIASSPRGTDVVMRMSNTGVGTMLMLGQRTHSSHGHNSGRASPSGTTSPAASNSNSLMRRLTSSPLGALLPVSPTSSAPLNTPHSPNGLRAVVPPSPSGGSSSTPHSPFSTHAVVVGAPAAPLLGMQHSSSGNNLARGNSNLLRATASMLRRNSGLRRCSGPGAANMSAPLSRLRTSPQLATVPAGNSAESPGLDDSQHSSPSPHRHRSVRSPLSPNHHEQREHVAMPAPSAPLLLPHSLSAQDALHANAVHACNHQTSSALAQRRSSQLDQRSSLHMSDVPSSSVLGPCTSGGSSPPLGASPAAGRIGSGLFQLPQLWESASEAVATLSGEAPPDHEVEPPPGRMRSRTTGQLDLALDETSFACNVQLQLPPHRQVPDSLSALQGFDGRSGTSPLTMAGHGSPGGKRSSGVDLTALHPARTSGWQGRASGSDVAASPTSPSFTQLLTKGFHAIHTNPAFRIPPPLQLPRQSDSSASALSPSANSPAVTTPGTARSTIAASAAVPHGTPPRRVTVPSAVQPQPPQATATAAPLAVPLTTDVLQHAVSSHRAAAATPATATTAWNLGFGELVASQLAAAIANVASGSLPLTAPMLDDSRDVSGPSDSRTSMPADHLHSGVMLLPSPNDSADSRYVHALAAAIAAGHASPLPRASPSRVLQVPPAQQQQQAHPAPQQEQTQPPSQQQQPQQHLLQHLGHSQSEQVRVPEPPPDHNSAGGSALPGRLDHTSAPGILLPPPPVHSPLHLDGPGSGSAGGGTQHPLQRPSLSSSTGDPHMYHTAGHLASPASLNTLGLPLPPMHGLHHHLPALMHSSDHPAVLAGGTRYSSMVSAGVGGTGAARNARDRSSNAMHASIDRPLVPGSPGGANFSSGLRGSSCGQTPILGGHMPIRQNSAGDAAHSAAAAAGAGRPGASPSWQQVAASAGTTGAGQRQPGNALGSRSTGRSGQVDHGDSNSAAAAVAAAAQQAAPSGAAGHHRPVHKTLSMRARSGHRASNEGQLNSFEQLMLVASQATEVRALMHNSGGGGSARQRSAGSGTATNSPAVYGALMLTPQAWPPTRGAATSAGTAGLPPSAAAAGWAGAASGGRGSMRTARNSAPGESFMASVMAPVAEAWPTPSELHHSLKRATSSFPAPMQNSDGVNIASPPLPPTGYSPPSSTGATPGQANGPSLPGSNVGNPSALHAQGQQAGGAGASHGAGTAPLPGTHYIRRSAGALQALLQQQQQQQQTPFATNSGGAATGSGGGADTAPHSHRRFSCVEPSLQQQQQLMHTSHGSNVGQGSSPFNSIQITGAMGLASSWDASTAMAAAVAGHLPPHPGGNRGSRVNSRRSSIGSVGGAMALSPTGGGGSSLHPSGHPARTSLPHPAGEEQHQSAGPAGAYHQGVAQGPGSGHMAAPPTGTPPSPERGLPMPASARNAPYSPPIGMPKWRYHSVDNATTLAAGHDVAAVPPGRSPEGHASLLAGGQSMGPPVPSNRWRSPRNEADMPSGGGATGASTATPGGQLSARQYNDPSNTPGRAGTAGASGGGGGDASVNGGGGPLGRTTPGGSLPPAAAAATGSGSGPPPPPPADGAGAAGDAANKDSRPAVMAECYRITQQPAGSGSNEVAQSITYLKYKHLKQELEQTDMDEGDDAVPVPTTSLLVPTVAVEVVVWSLGSFRLKGVTEPMKLVQVLPAALQGRMSLANRVTLNRGKARCIAPKIERLHELTLHLPDVTRLSCVSLMMPGMGGGDDGMWMPDGYEGVDPSGAGGYGPGGGYAYGGYSNGGYGYDDGVGVAGGSGGGGGMGYNSVSLTGDGSLPLYNQGSLPITSPDGVTTGSLMGTGPPASLGGFASPAGGATTPQGRASGIDAAGGGSQAGGANGVGTGRPPAPEAATLPQYSPLPPLTGHRGTATRMWQSPTGGLPPRANAAVSPWLQQVENDLLHRQGTLRELESNDGLAPISEAATPTNGSVTSSAILPAVGSLQRSPHGNVSLMQAAMAAAAATGSIARSIGGNVSGSDSLAGAGSSRSFGTASPSAHPSGPVPWRSRRTVFPPPPVIIPGANDELLGGSHAGGGDTYMPMAAPVVPSSSSLRASRLAAAARALSPRTSEELAQGKQSQALVNGSTEPAATTAAAAERSQLAAELTSLGQGDWLGSLPVSSTADMRHMILGLRNAGGDSGTGGSGAAGGFGSIAPPGRQDSLAFSSGHGLPASLAHFYSTQANHSVGVEVTFASSMLHDAQLAAANASNGLENLDGSASRSMREHASPAGSGLNAAGAGQAIGRVAVLASRHASPFQLCQSNSDSSPGGGVLHAHSTGTSDGSTPQLAHGAGSGNGMANSSSASARRPEDNVMVGTSSENSSAAMPPPTFRTSIMASAAAAAANGAGGIIGSPGGLRRSLLQQQLQATSSADDLARQLLGLPPGVLFVGTHGSSSLEASLANGELDALGARYSGSVAGSLATFGLATPGSAGTAGQLSLLGSPLMPSPTGVDEADVLKGSAGSREAMRDRGGGTSAVQATADSNGNMPGSAAAGSGSKGWVAEAPPVAVREGTEGEVMPRGEAP